MTSDGRATGIDVSTEMSLHVLAYNLKRVIAILGMPRTITPMNMVGG